MKRLSKQSQIPDNSIIGNNFDRIDYFDSYQVSINLNNSIDSITTKIFEIPKWVKCLLKLRNILVKPFGLQTDDERKLNYKDYYEIGERAIFFTVIARNANEIVMSENDKHLIFRTSVLKSDNQNATDVYLTTVVKYNNFGGRFYFFFVKPFHRLIIKSLLKRL